MKQETVYLGHSNSIDLILKAQSATSTASSAISLSSSTKMSLTLDGIVIESTNSTGQAITWNKAGYLTGEIHLHLGSLSTLSTGTYDAVLVVYTSDSTDQGYVWGDPIPIRIKPDPEGT